MLRRNQGVEIHGHFSVDLQGRSALINESVVLETYYDEPVSWQEQLRVHSIVLEFLSLAAWRPCGISRMRVAKALGEQPPSANGEGSRWLEVATQELPLEDAKVERHRFIYPFRDSGPDALDRWLEMHDSYTEVIHPLLSIINSGYHWDNEAAVQSSISLEALAFNISGLPKREWRGVRYRKALDIITDSLGEMPFTDVEQWKSDAVKVYNGAKHPNHAMSGDGLRVETIRRNVAVVRFWFGLQMGYSPEVLNSGFDLDPLLKPGFR